MHQLSNVDYAVIATYFVVLIGIGFALRKIASQNMDSYFLAGNKLPWWMLGVSGMGYSLDIAGTMLIISLLYMLGPRGLFIEFRGGVSLALLCQMIWTGKWHRRSGCMTVAEWMTFRFGHSKGADFARIATAVCFIVFAASMLVYMARGVGLFLSLFLPFSPFVCALVLLGIAALYTAMSGLYGVVVSDLFQCGLIVLGVVFVVFLALGHLDDVSQLQNFAESITGQSLWTTSYPNVSASMPPGYEQYESLLLYTMFFLVLNKLIIGGFGTGHEPQFFAARDERECGKLACLWAVLMTFRWPMMIAYAILGLYLVNDFYPDQSVLEQAAASIKETLSPGESQWPEVIANLKNRPKDFPAELIASLETMLGPDWTQKIDLIGYHGTVNAERILPSVLLYRVGSGFRGLILVTLISASMSTFDMTMNKAAAMFTNDIYRKYVRPDATHKHLMRVTYLFFAVLLVIAFVMAYQIPNINTIWGWITMGLWSGIGMPLLLRFYWWRFNGAGFGFGVLGGLSAAIGVLLWNTFSAAESQLSEVAQFLVLTPISFCCAVAGTYLAPATEESVLTNFFRKTKPFGFWKPLQSVLSADERTDMRTEHRNDLIALPIGFVWMVTMYLLPMQLLIRDYLSSVVTGTLFLASCWGLYRFWYLALPPSSATAGRRAPETTLETPAETTLSTH